MELLTSRTRLRFIEITDLEVIHSLLSLPEVDRYNTMGIPDNIEVTRTIIEPSIAANKLEIIRRFTFAIEDKTTSEFRGLIGLMLGDDKYKRGEVWFKLFPNYWNKGYATEALKAVLVFAFDSLNLHRIEAGCAVDNIGSARVLEKVGMTREGRGRQVLPLASGWSDNFEYAILETDERV